MSSAPPSPNPAAPSRPRWDIELGITWGALGLLLAGLAAACLFVVIAGPFLAFLWMLRGSVGNSIARAVRLVEHPCECLMGPLAILGAICCLIGIGEGRGRADAILGLVFAVFLMLFIGFFAPWDAIALGLSSTAR